MGSTSFPLLRSSPAVGTGSYGALPAIPHDADGGSYAGSSHSISSASEEGRIQSPEDEPEGNGYLTVGGVRANGNQRALNTPSAGLRERGLRGKDSGEADEILEQDAGEQSFATGSDDGEEEEDEQDPVDNSLCVGNDYSPSPTRY